MNCEDCMPKRVPTFPKWDDKAKYWSKAKKAKKLKELCCELNGKVWTK